jgi:hypothetical protein
MAARADKGLRRCSDAAKSAHGGRRDGPRGAHDSPERGREHG